MKILIKLVAWALVAAWFIRTRSRRLYFMWATRNIKLIEGPPEPERVGGEPTAEGAFNKGLEAHLKRASVKSAEEDMMDEFFGTVPEELERKVYPPVWQSCEPTIRVSDFFGATSAIPAAIAACSALSSQQNARQSAEARAAQYQQRYEFELRQMQAQAQGVVGLSRRRRTVSRG